MNTNIQYEYNLLDSIFRFQKITDSNVLWGEIYEDISNSYGTVHCETEGQWINDIGQSYDNFVSLIHRLHLDIPLKDVNNLFYVKTFYQTLLANNFKSPRKTYNSKAKGFNRSQESKRSLFEMMKPFTYSCFDLDMTGNDLESKISIYKNGMSELNNLYLNDSTFLEGLYVDFLRSCNPQALKGMVETIPKKYDDVLKGIGRQVLFYIDNCINKKLIQQDRSTLCFVILIYLGYEKKGEKYIYEMLDQNLPSKTDIENMKFKIAEKVEKDFLSQCSAKRISGAERFRLKQEKEREVKNQLTLWINHKSSSPVKAKIHDRMDFYFK